MDSVDYRAFIFAGAAIIIVGFMLIDNYVPVWGIVANAMRGHISIGNSELPYRYVFIAGVAAVAYGLYVKTIRKTP